MRLLIDEMWPAAMAEQLRDRGHDVWAVAERRDLRGQPDEVVFETAQFEGRAILTEDVTDYGALTLQTVRDGRHHSGLICTNNRGFPRRDPATVGRVVLALDSLLSNDRDLTDLVHWLS